MKYFVTLILVFISLNAYAGLHEPPMVCLSEDGKMIIDIVPSTTFFGDRRNLCAKHSKIQYEWETFAYYRVVVNEDSLSGVSCKEDVNFEFRSAQKYKDENLVIKLYTDRPQDQASLIKDGVVSQIICQKIRKNETREEVLDLIKSWL